MSLGRGYFQKELFLIFADQQGLGITDLRNGARSW